MIKIGQIGIGHNHSDKIKVIRKHPELFQLVGYAEENEEWVARRGQEPHFRDVPRMSVEEIIEKSDAILVETDVWDLTRTAQLCVDAGKHVHMDKPASGTLEEYKHLLDTARAKGLTVQLGYMYRYNPAVQELLKLAKEGALGAIVSIEAEMSIRHNDRYRKWLSNFKGGDMYIFGCHLIDLIVYLLGEPNKVLSSLVSSNVAGVTCDDITSAILQYDHAIARVSSTSLDWDGWDRRCFSVVGELGTAHIQPMEVPCRMTFAPKRTSGTAMRKMAQPVELPAVDSMENRYDAMLLGFYDYVTGRQENPFSYDHEYAVQKVLWDAVGGVEMLGTALEEEKPK